MSQWWSRVLSGVKVVAVGGSNVLLLFVVWWILYWQFYQFTSVKITDLGRFPCRYQTYFRGPHSRIGLYVNWNKSFLTFPVQFFAISFFTSEKTPLLMAQLHDIRNILRKTVPKTFEMKPQSEFAFSGFRIPKILGVELGWINFELRDLFEDLFFACDEISDFDDSNLSIWLIEIQWIQKPILSQSQWSNLTTSGLYFVHHILLKWWISERTDVHAVRTWETKWSLRFCFSSSSVPHSAYRRFSPLQVGPCIQMSVFMHCV